MTWADDEQERMVLMALITARSALLEHYLKQTLTLLLSADPVVAHVFATQASAHEMINSCERILKESERKGVDRGSPELSEALKAARVAMVVGMTCYITSRCSTPRTAETLPKRGSRGAIKTSPR